MISNKNAEGPYEKIVNLPTSGDLPVESAGLPGYFTAADMVRAFNIPDDQGGANEAVRAWVRRHGEYSLAEFEPGRWSAK